MKIVATIAVAVVAVVHMFISVVERVQIEKDGFLSKSPPILNNIENYVNELSQSRHI